MPDPEYLLISLVFSSVGFGYFIYGKKQKHKIIYYTGIGLMGFPYVIATMPAMLIVGVVLLATPKILKYFGVG